MALKKGDAGCKLCVLCRNIFSEASEVVGEEDEQLLRCNAKEYTDLDLANSDDLRYAVRRLNALHDDPAFDVDEFETREKPLTSGGPLTTFLATQTWTHT